MPSVKVNPIATLKAQLTAKKRILVLGPLDIELQKCHEKLMSIRPDCIILVDGGIRHRKLLSKSQQKIAISVGDGDSKKSSKEELDIKLPPEKDYSDLKFVLRVLLKLKGNLDKLEFLGLSSNQFEKRTDHLLINIGEISTIIKKLSIPVSLDDRFLFLPKGESIIHYIGIFSIFCLKTTSVKIWGACDYQLTDWTKMPALSSLGLSNVGKGKINITAKAPVIVYFTGVSLKK